ncbi:MAG TPA: hypothetical protein VLI92_04910 [Candidatus Saccharimonadales bacterium]|nr:hypothetical protein [Candidatus Saccharimonadales bacterium]
MPQTTKNLNWCRILFFSTLVIFVITLAAQIVLTNRLALKSHELTLLVGQKEELQKSITKLEFEDASLSSLSYVDQQARKMGFVDMHDSVIAIGPASVAAILTQ